MMTVDHVESRRKWGIALIITIFLLIASVILTFIVASFTDSEWLYLYFCWGNILLLSAIVIMLLGLVTGGPFPKTERWWEGAGWGVLLGGMAFALFAFTPSCCGDYTDHMRNLACFGTMVALFAFAIGAAMRRYSVILLAGTSFYLWAILFQDEVTVIVFTVASLAVAGAFLYWLNRAVPPKKSDSEYPKIEDILNDPEVIRATTSTGKGIEGWSEFPDDPEEAMAMLERMAQEQSNSPTDDELPEWLAAIDEPKRERLPENPFPKDTFQEENILDKSSPALFAIFVVLLIVVLFFLTFVAVFMR